MEFEFVILKSQEEEGSASNPFFVELCRVQATYLSLLRDIDFPRTSLLPTEKFGSSVSHRFLPQTEKSSSAYGCYPPLHYQRVHVPSACRMVGQASILPNNISPGSKEAQR